MAIGRLVAAVRVSREFAEQPELLFKLNTLVVNLRLVVNNVTHLCANGHDQSVERYVNPQTRAQACRACDNERQRRKREERAARKALAACRPRHATDVKASVYLPPVGMIAHSLLGQWMGPR